MSLNWDGDPRTLEADPAWAAELDRCLDVLCGTRRWALTDYADERLCVVAAIGESCRQSGAPPSPFRIVTVLRRLGLPDRGALRWIQRAAFGDERLEAAS